jgi:hypothetical protein
MTSGKSKTKNGALRLGLFFVGRRKRPAPAHSNFPFPTTNFQLPTWNLNTPTPNLHPPPTPAPNPRNPFSWWGTGLWVHPTPTDPTPTSNLQPPTPNHPGDGINCPPEEHGGFVENPLVAVDYVQTMGAAVCELISLFGLCSMISYLCYIYMGGWQGVRALDAGLLLGRRAGKNSNVQIGRDRAGEQTGGGGLRADHGRCEWVCELISFLRLHHPECFNV